MEITIETMLTAGATIILAIVTGWKTFRSQPKEGRKTDSETVAKFEEVAAKVVERNKNLLDRIHCVEDKYDRVEDELQHIRGLMADWEYGINLLIDQLCEAGLDPDWRPKPSKSLTED